jgi:RimJ/RimL family protein N-acetyltransferase
MNCSLQTERLQLRWMTLADAELMLAVWNDPAFVRFVGDRGIRTLDEARTTMEEGAMKLYSDYGYGPFRVALRDDDSAIGICGLFRRDGLDDPDIGFATLPGYCGKGYAHEAACAVVDHARHDLGLARLTAIVSPENEASVGLIRKLGLQFERMHHMAGDDDEVAIYGMRLHDTDES